MWRFTIEFTLIALVTAAIPASASVEPHAADPAFTVVNEDVLVRRVVWPVIITERRGLMEPGACDAPTPQDIVLEEDGRPVEITHIDAPGWIRNGDPQTDWEPSVPVTHALLIDMSISMDVDDRLEHAKKAASRYVDALPSREQALVAAFDDTMVLISPPSANRKRTRRDIETIRLGNGTALWDAVYEVLQYLETLPGQKVVVLLTDGSDSTSITRLASKSIHDLAAEKSDITLFAIGVDLFRHERNERSRTRGFLRDLAAATGGRYYETRGVGMFPEIFDRIRDHLSRRFYVVYVPEPFGRGPKDDLQARPYRHRSVRVKSVNGLPCKVVTAGPPTRIEGRFGTSVTRVEPSNPAISAAEPALPQNAHLPAGYRVSEELTLPAPNGWPLSRRDTPSLYVIDPPGDLLPGRSPDIILDRGFLFQDRAYSNAGKFKTSLNRRPEIEMRDFVVDVPTFAEVRDCLNRPEDIMLRLLERGYCASGESHLVHERSPLLIHGKTFLEMRSLIGLALFENYPEYRRWATDRLREEAIPEVERVIARLESEGPLTAEQKEIVRDAMLNRAVNPESDEAQRYLAEWLGDIRARDLALALETRLANALVKNNGAEERWGELAATIADAGWAALLEWFPPATEVRVLSPLVPAYDPDRDAIGFFRVILPRPSLDGSPLDSVPEEPLGLRTLDWMIQSQDEFATALKKVRIESVEHDTLTRRGRQGLNRKFRDAGRSDAAVSVKSPLRRVRVTFDALDTPDGALELTAYYDGNQGVPRYVTTCLEGQTSPFLTELVARVSGLDAYVGLPCRDESR